MNSIVNQFTDYIRRAMAMDFDILSKSLAISNVALNDINNILTITTTTPHNLIKNSYVFLDGLYYKEAINYIKKVEVIENYIKKNLIEINIPFDVSFNINTFLKLTGFTDVSLNKDFLIKNITIGSNDTINLQGYINQTEVPNIDIQNEGFACYKLYDDFYIDVSGININDNYINNLGNIAGAYNGMKVVDEVVDVNIFKVKLVSSGLSVKPVYKPIYFTGAKIKVNTFVDTSMSLNQDMIDNEISDFQDNMSDGKLFIVKSNSDISQNQTLVESSFTAIGNGITNFSAQNTQFLQAVLLFRVQRDVLNNNRSQYILGYKANEIAENFEGIFSKHINSVFFDFDIAYKNVSKLNFIYESIFTGVSNLDRVGDLPNTVFYIMTANFKVSRFVFGYGENSINNIGVPIKKVDIKMRNDRNSNEDLISYGN
jgi:hypothetical protein